MVQLSHAVCFEIQVASEVTDLLAISLFGVMALAAVIASLAAKLWARGLVGVELARDVIERHAGDAAEVVPDLAVGGGVVELELVDGATELTGDLECVLC